MSRHGRHHYPAVNGKLQSKQKAEVSTSLRPQSGVPIFPFWTQNLSWLLLWHACGYCSAVKQLACEQVFSLGMSRSWLMNQVMDCSQCVYYWQRKTVYVYICLLLCVVILYKLLLFCVICCYVLLFVVIYLPCLSHFVVICCYLLLFLIKLGSHRWQPKCLPRLQLFKLRRLGFKSLWLCRLRMLGYAVSE
jgi:hypothetical protein